MTISAGGGGSNAGDCFTISQLLYVARMKLRDSTFGGRVATTMNQVEVDRLEQDALEVLNLVRSMKNNFASINRIPGAVLSLIPNYWDRQYIDTNQDLVALTHVCRGWRKLFISRPSLWTRLDFTNVDKTRTYIERSRSSCLDVTIHKSKGEFSLEDALLLAIPHIQLFKSLTVVAASDLQNLTRHLIPPAPSLEELTVDFDCDPAPVLDNTLFDGDLSSLRTLSLGGIVTSLPWKNLQNLTTFKLRCSSDNRVTVTQLLDFLESAPHLKNITLRDSIPSSSDAPSSRTVSLSHLKNLTIFGDPIHGVLLNHLSIPAGVSLVLDFNFSGNQSPLPDCLPKTNKELKNLCGVTTVNLCFDGETKFVRMAGPSGRLCMFGHWENATRAASLDLDRRIFQSLKCFSLRMTRSLAITGYECPTLTGAGKPTKTPHILHRMKNLRTLTLTRCVNLPFIHALNPGDSVSKTTLCPVLEELVLYVETRDAFNIPGLMDMAKERALAGAKLRSITIVGLGDLLPAKRVFVLREHVERVEYRVEENPPSWDSFPDYESD